MTAIAASIFELDLMMVRCDLLHGMSVASRLTCSSGVVPKNVQAVAAATTKTKRTIQFVDSSPLPCFKRRIKISRNYVTMVMAQEAAGNFLQCVEELAGRVSMQNVAATALALMRPVHVCGLKARHEQIFTTSTMWMDPPKTIVSQ